MAKKVNINQVNGVNINIEDIIIVDDVKPSPKMYPFIACTPQELFDQWKIDDKETRKKRATKMLEKWFDEIRTEIKTSKIMAKPYVKK